MNWGGMSIDSEFFDDLDIVDCISLPSDMIFPATGNPASSLSPPNGVPQESPSTTPSMSDNDCSSFSLTLNSFMFNPVLMDLPGLYLDQNVYYIHGSITKDDLERLRDYTRMVSKFIVTDVANKGSEAGISPATFLRLARLQHPDIPLLPSLSDLVIVNADASIAYLELPLTHSLKSLEASYISDTQQSTFFSFLTIIQQESPLLQTLILGPGWFHSNSLQIISKFYNLRHLELKNVNSEIPFAFFENIGSLPKLETFILDARFVSNIVTKNQPNRMGEPIVPQAPPFEGVIDGKSNKDGVGDGLLSRTCPTPISTSGAFNQLAKLHVIGWLPLLQDLIPRITSTRLEDFAATLIRLSDDELQVNLAKEKAENEKRDEEKRKRDEEQKRKRDEEQKQKRILHNFWGFGSVGGRRQGPLVGKKKQSNLTSSKMPMTSELEEERERLLKEQERLASVSFEFYTMPFTRLLWLLCCRSPTSLKTVSVCQLDRSNFQRLLKPPTLPEEMFLGLLLLPAIESLEVKGWMLDSVQSMLDITASIPNLKSLLLPLDESNSGISLSTLRHVAITCPKLEYFQCRIELLSLIPKYTVPTIFALSHGLRTLSVGNSSPLPDAKQLYLIARHLYLLFPNLETINTSEEYNVEQWTIVDELVKMCQTARTDDMHRPSMPICTLLTTNCT